MNKTLEVGVIGLGKFGFQAASTLVELGHKVIGIDSRPEVVRVAQDTLTRAFEANALDRAALEQLRLQDLDAIIVSVGESMESSILITLDLLELGAERLIVKAISPAHKKVLKRLGVHQVIQPEADAAVHTAYRLHNPGTLDFLGEGGGILIQELTVVAWAGKSLLDLDLREKHSVLIAAKRGPAQEEFEFVPDPKLPFAKGDRLLAIGRAEAISELVP